MTRAKPIHTAFGTVAALAAWLLLIATPVAAADGTATFRHGIGLAHAMAWAQIEAGPERAFVFPPFSDPSRAITPSELQALRQAGFDFIRLAVDPGPFLEFEGAQRAATDRILLDRVNLILAAGLAVVVDFHPSDMHPAYTAQVLTAGSNMPVFQDYLRMIEHTAGLLDALHTDKVALELLNEPPVRPSAWQGLLEAAYAAARRGSANLVLVVEGGDEGSAAALMAMRVANLANDPAVLFSFHYYDPYQFTHQGASWNAARYLADVPYPAQARPLQDSLDATAAAITASDLSPEEKSAAWRDAQSRLANYWRSAFDRGSIEPTFAQVTGWARSQGLSPNRVMLGEFGAKKTALQSLGLRAAERSQWFHDVRETAERHGFGWAVWVYRGEGGFGLTQGETGDDLDPEIAAALGLIAHVQRKATSEH